MTVLVLRSTTSRCLLNSFFLSEYFMENIIPDAVHEVPHRLYLRLNRTLEQYHAPSPDPAPVAAWQPTMTFSDLILRGPPLIRPIPCLSIDEGLRDSWSYF